MASLSITFGRNEKGKYKLCNRNKVWFEVGKFVSKMRNSCQQCEKSTCFNCKAYFFVLSQLEKTDLQYRFSNECLLQITLKLMNLNLK